jgi:transcription termination/antitermination protein NusG
MPHPWFALHTRSRAEKVVETQLTQKGFESFLPTIKRWSRWKDRRKEIQWPLFPGYCFARFAPSDHLAVLQCRGVAAVVGFGGEPVPVPDAEIDAVRTLVQSTLQYDPAPFIKEGMRVEVVHGPLKGVVGRMVRKGNHARLILSIDLIGQAVSAEVDAADVVPI